MFSASFRRRNTQRLSGGLATLVVLALVSLVACGCASKQEKALEQAKKQAAATGQPQQVVSVDKNGTTTTTVVQPPASGQANQAIATTQTPPVSGGPVPAAMDPKVSPAPKPPLNVSVPAGTMLAIRVDQRISVKHARNGDSFTGEIVEPILASDNSVLVPKGSRVGGVVVESHKRGHFKGRSLLELRLTKLTLNGTEYPLMTRDIAESKKGKGKRSAAFIAGGSGAGMLVGGLATGGVGLAVGGLVGGGVGTGIAGLTGNRDIEIRAESIVRFQLADDLVVQES